MMYCRKISEISGKAFELKKKMCNFVPVTYNLIIIFENINEFFLKRYLYKNLFSA